MANDIAVTLTSDTRQFSKGLKRAQDDMAVFSTAMKTVGTAVAGFLSFQAIKAGLGTLTETIGKLDDLAAQAERLGVSTEFLSELHHAAKLSDTEVEALNGGLEKLEKNLGKAAEDGGELAKTLEGLGLNAEELAAAGPEEAFLKIADAVKGIEDPFQRAKVVTDIFGKSGQSLIGILAKGRDGINELRQEAIAMGASLGKDASEQIGKADDAMKRLSSSWMGFKTILAVELAPALTDFVDLLRSSVIPALGDAAGEFSLFIEHVRDLKAMLAEGINPFSKEAMDFMRKRMLPKSDEFQAQPQEPVPVAPPAGAPPAADLIVKGIAREFKSLAAPLSIESKEGFSALAKALTKPASSDPAAKQLAEAKEANKHLANIEKAVLNEPRIAPPF